MFYVYALIDPRTDQPFYVGKGKHGNDRHLDHFTNAENRYLRYKIAYFKRANMEVPVRFIREFIEDEADAYALEEEVISQYGRANIDKGGILVNICKNRNPPSWSGRKQSQEHIHRRIESYKATCKLNGKKSVSDVTKKKISIGVSGKKNGFYGKTHSDEVKQSHAIRMAGNTNNSKIFRMTSPTGDIYVVEGQLYKFCKSHNLPISTIEAMLYRNYQPKKGRAVGWKIEKYHAEEYADES